ncbi:MobA/MobL family protein [Dyella agri]|uniref:MobA/MobL family protein n=1 Tax=Dyella agri TaxID=1926869 RepID=A0ABW8KCU6_9GAMM
MIPYHFEIKSGKRGSSLEHINYVTRTGAHGEHEDLVTTAFGNLPTWAGNDPKAFFRASEKYERKNAPAFRSMTFNLPKDLTIEQNKRLAIDISHALTAGKPFLLAVHAPVSALAGEFHPHGHLMMSDRMPDDIERSAELTFRRYNASHPEKGGCRKDSGGKNRAEHRDWVIEQRKLVAEHINEALERHGHHDRVDHRTLRQRGESRQPESYLGPARVRRMSSHDKQQYLDARQRQRRKDEGSTFK